MGISFLSSLLRYHLDGLSFLHYKKGVMHRDIKRNNLGVATLSLLRDIIFDLDSATGKETSRDHGVGTLGCLAPETVASKTWDML